MITPFKNATNPENIVLRIFQTSFYLYIIYVTSGFDASIGDGLTLHDV